MTRRQKIFAAVAGFTVAVANVIVLAWPRHRVPDLMESATTIMPMKGTECFLPYWDDSGACLCVDQTSAGVPKISRIDMARRTIEPLSIVNSAISRLLPVKIRSSQMLNLYPSLDNQWVWAGTDVNSSKYASSHDIFGLRLTYAIRIPDGLSYKVELKNPYSPVMWLPDKQRWLEETGTGSWVVHSLNRPEKADDLPISTHATTSATTTAFDPNPILRTLPDGRWITAGWNRDGFSRRVRFWSMQTTTNTVNTSLISTVNAPEDAIVENIAVSPDGKSLAYCLLCRNPERLLNPVLNMMGYFDCYPLEEIQVWTSTIQGKGMHECYRTSPSVGKEFGQLRWTPDGKRLTFSHNDTLYSVLVPETSVQ